MRFKVFYIIVLLFSSCVKKTKNIQNSFDCEDEIACYEYQKQLKLVHDYNFLMKDLNIDSMVKIGAFFEKITKLKTTADIQYDGLMSPTVQDYKNWSIWYSQNYDCLLYDSKEKALTLKDNCVLEF
jgi:hypothetical protein